MAASRPAHQYRVRHREARLDPRPQMTTLDGCAVQQVSYTEAKALIVKYEWLKTMPAIVTASYGLRTPSGELVGAVCLGPCPGTASADLCGPEWRDKAIGLLRGCCVHWAPRNAASFLISRACGLAAKDFGWRIFVAYADQRAGERGVVYQSCSWLYLGIGNGRGRKLHGRGRWRFYDKRTQTWLTDRALRKRGISEAHALGDLRWRAEKAPDKGRYVWFAGDRRERAALRAALRYPILPYPKRPARSAA
jgi:hypothetical protein